MTGFTHLLGCGIPVLVGLSVDESPHIEPRGRIGLRWILGILELARNDYCDEIALGQDSYDLRVQLITGRRSRPSAEKLHHAFTTRADIGIVLNVPACYPLVGLVPMIALQQVLHDMKRRLLVPIELGVCICEERFWVCDTDDWLLSGCCTGDQRERRNREWHGKSFYERRVIRSA